MFENDRVMLTMPVGPRDHSQGPENALVTLVEYGDYECPYCAQAYPIVRKIQEQLGSQLRLVFRNFPMTLIHPHAQHAAEAAEAAAAQGYFQEMQSALFRHQRALSDPHLTEYAAAIGLDSARFQDDLVNHTHASRVREDFLSGVRSGVSGAPTFFINGLRYSGAWDFETMLNVLRRASLSFELPASDVIR